MKERCPWCGGDPLYVAYHDAEWGVPVHDDRRLFEFLILEGAQAGLSWLTILRKRENYRKAFDAFDAVRVAAYGRQDIRRLLHDPGIVRNRLKIEAAIRNARGALAIREEFGSLDAFLWRYVDGTPVQNAWRRMSEVPTKTKASDQMSQDLRKRGFNFVGSTICYAFMQAVGMVNDHLTACFRHKEIAPRRRGRIRQQAPGRKSAITPIGSDQEAPDVQRHPSARGSGFSR
ncbi:MAG: DNA-3-methyladenine glycosylase I [Verrucomicrobiae bacterium]|nr:DNA-3-methyladenine glycosylase I [Verrucomicrobiae bacterium]